MFPFAKDGVPPEVNPDFMRNEDRGRPARGRGGGGFSRGRGSDRMTGDKRTRDGDADLQLLQEQYEFVLKQLSGRITERCSKRQSITPFDELFLLWSFYYERRDARHVQLLVQSPVRRPWKSLEEALDALPDDSLDDVVKQLDQLSTEFAGVEETARREELNIGANAEDDVDSPIVSSPGAFWNVASNYLQALKSSRAVPANALEENIENRVVELVNKNKADIHRLVARLQAILASPQSKDVDPTTGTTPVDVQFFTAALGIANVTRWSTVLAEFHEAHFLGDDSVPEPEIHGPVGGEGEGNDQGDTSITMAVDESDLPPGEQDGDWDEFTGEVNYGANGPNTLAVGRPASAVPTIDGKRKPYRVAKVKMGYFWNRYNKAHYDYKNPPPKIVLGYEFTLFYPELADARKIPEYRVEPTEKGWSDDHCVLVFVSNSNKYADVAYRIMNKQWDKRRGGVKCRFDAKGRFYLYFRFEHGSYRR